MNKILELISMELTVILTAALPIIELRGAIPIGISLGLNPIHATVLAFIGSMIPVPFILFFVRPIFKYLRTTRIFRSFINKLTDKSLNTNSYKIKKYGAWGLILLVAIPLPGTGVWSASLIAALMNIRFKWAFPAIFLGNVIAGLLIMLISSGILRLNIF